jgi:uncharacterized cupredoxin-like copper-binding protein
VVSGRRSKVVVGVASLALVASAGTAAVAAKGPPPKQATITAVTKVQVKVNRYVKDNLRWQKDVYQVRSGGTLKLVNKAADEGPHTFTVVKPKDLPKTPKQIFNCAICETLGAAHGADPNSDAPPKFNFLENGVGQDTPPNVDQPGDSALLGPNKGDSLSLTVTAKKGTTLRFMCLIHPWMQAKVLVR